MKIFELVNLLANGIYKRNKKIEKILLYWIKYSFEKQMIYIWNEQTINFQVFIWNAMVCYLNIYINIINK
jgi:hypothetical protein